ncbi:hypothetical protein GmHk_13G037835 [Glycine max]|nr:hypothetical protein GmHk_13G037835 [Glycine max]KAH1217116.1 hypothetical protein GmHk_13G037835 [Glycine max]
MSACLACVTDGILHGTLQLTVLLTIYNDGTPMSSVLPASMKKETDPFAPYNKFTYKYPQGEGEIQQKRAEVADVGPKWLRMTPLFSSLRILFLSAPVSVSLTPHSLPRVFLLLKYHIPNTLSSFFPNYFNAILLSLSPNKPARFHLSSLPTLSVSKSSVQQHKFFEMGT